MPRTKVQEKSKPAQHVAANVAYYATFYDYTEEKLAAVMHCCLNTFKSRTKNPGTFQIAELQRLADSFHVSISALITKR